MKNLYGALLRFQQKVGPVAKNAKNEFHKSNYATLDELISTVRPVLCECELGMYQVVVGQELRTVLFHTGGEQIESVVPIDPLLDRAGIVAGGSSKINVLQSYGSALTYLRRYSLFAILGLAPEDDDGQGFAGAPQAKRPEGKKLPDRTAYIGAFGTPEELQAFFNQRRAAKSLEPMPLSELPDMQFFQLADLFIEERKNK